MERPADEPPPLTAPSIAPSSKGLSMRARLRVAIAWAKAHHRDPIVLVSACAISLLVLYSTGLLLPLIRFLLSATVAIAAAGAIYSCVRIVILTHTAADPQHPPSCSTHKTTGFVCGLLAVVCGLLLFLLPSGQGPSVKGPTSAASPAADVTNKASETEARTEGRTSSRGNEAPHPVTPSVSQDASRDHDTPSRSQSAATSEREASQADDSDRAVANFLGTLIQAGMQQQQQAERDPRYQQFRQGLENASRCPRCGGAGVYRYVDDAGVLQSRSCPSCLGSGRAF